MIKHATITLLLFLFHSSYAAAQTPKTWPTPVPVEPTGVSIIDGKFVSESGRFSISIAEMPTSTLDFNSEANRTKGLDAGKQHIWQSGQMLYTIMYLYPIDDDGNPLPHKFEDVLSGSRKGVLRNNGTILSEKLFPFGNFIGTELRYVSPTRLNLIGRLFIVDGIGYQIVGGYPDGKEKEALAVLDSFKIIEKK